ncbi:helicase [Tanacetum coccineum]
MTLVQLRALHAGKLAIGNTRRVDSEDSDDKVICAPSDGPEDAKNNSPSNKKKKRDSLNKDTCIPSLSNILHNSMSIQSNIIITLDGNVQSYCGLRLTNMPTPTSGEKQKAADSTSNYPLNRSEVRTSGVLVTYHNLGPPSYQCRNCNAQMWYEERNNKGYRAVNPTFSLCYQEGNLLLPKFKETPLPLDKLLDFKDPGTSKFRDQIRVYNGMFCFTSFSAKIDHSINTGRGVYTFRINGQNYHRIRYVLLASGVQPRYTQLYFFDTHNEVRNRMSVFLDKETSEGVDETIVIGLIAMLDETSAVAKAFRMARNWCHSHESVNFELHLLSDRRSARKYNAPTVSEVAALITNDFGNGVPLRDIVVHNKDGGPKRISELRPSYMALQYPLLFPYEEDGFHEKIPYRNNTGTKKTKRGFQYSVDAYTAVEEQRLKWSRNNQETLRVDLYQNLNDVVTIGDTTAKGLGKRIAYVNPDLFITFTSNPKWPEIAEMLAFHPGQKPHERPEVGTWVFKMNLTELLDDLTKREVFGKSRAVVYVIEFQKHGLPHAHILLWLKEEWKCKTPGQIDDIISAEMPSPTDDPEGYKVVTEYTLHGPCGKGAACTIEGKCSKKFPKPFYAETMIDEDGYLVYRLRDSKVRAVKARKLTYAELPKNFVWDERAKIWKPRKQKKSIWRIYYLNPASGERYYLRMVLNVARGPRSFKEPMTVNKRLCATFKEACFAYGLLNGDKEWAHAFKEASFWALGPQLRDLFVTMLLFYDVSRTFQLWEQSWEILSEDILHKKRKLFKYPDLQLTDEQIKNYCLLEIETLLNRNGRSLTDF